MSLLNRLKKIEYISYIISFFIIVIWTESREKNIIKSENASLSKRWNIWWNFKIIFDYIIFEKSWNFNVWIVWNKWNEHTHLNNKFYIENEMTQHF